MERITLFPDHAYERIGKFRRFLSQFLALCRFRTVFVGIGYNEPDIIALSFMLKLVGVHVYVLSESKFDDMSRTIWREVAKALLLKAYKGAVVGSNRQLEYFRFLGFRGRPLLPGYDVVGQLGVPGRKGRRASTSGRPFLFVGRFVDKKNLSELLEGYALYAASAGSAVHRLVLVGSGPLEAGLRQQAKDLNVASLVDFPGFLDSVDVATHMQKALALVLVSRVEQWGLVVNEALSVGTPVIVSRAVGAGDALVRNLLNGFVIEQGSPEGIAEAMRRMANEPQMWQKMSDACLERSWLGDAERLADAVELLLNPAADLARQRIQSFLQLTGGTAHFPDAS